ncbi:MAG: hypothetical protein HDQ95_10115 [Roseburia sp.]|nr:hypothetical protein [Roseburia sp.]
MEVRLNYKDTLFRMIFSDRERLLSLYNALNGTDYDNSADLEISTLENAIYMNMKNDVSFVFDMTLSLYEHQSTVNPNLPLRNLFYVSKVLQNIVKNENLYGSKMVKIPTPKFVVFYNGVAEQPEKREYRLSDAFEKTAEQPELELTVTVLNINPGKNEELLEGCRMLKEYMQYVERVRKYLPEYGIEEAVKRAVTECIQEGILADFLMKYRAEAIEMSIFEYNEEAHMKSIREEGYDEGEIAGRIMGKAEAILELLEDYGQIPQKLRDRICAEKNLDVLKQWLKEAAKAVSLEEFVGKMG